MLSRTITEKFTSGIAREAEARSLCNVSCTFLLHCQSQQKPCWALQHLWGSWCHFRKTSSDMRVLCVFVKIISLHLWKRLGIWSGMQAPKSKQLKQHLSIITSVWAIAWILSASSTWKYSSYCSVLLAHDRSAGVLVDQHGQLQWCSVLPCVFQALGQSALQKPTREYRSKF